MRDMAEVVVNNRNSSKLLCLVAMLIGAGNSLLLVVVPLLVLYSGLDTAALAWLVALGSFLFLPSGPFWALRSDRFGRRVPLVVGLLGYAFSHLGVFILLLLGKAQLIGTSTLWFCFLAARILYGCTASALVPVSQAWLADLSSESDRAAVLTNFSSALAVGRFLGPVLVLLLLPIHDLAPLVLLVVMPLLLTVGVLRLAVPSAKVLPRPRERGPFDLSLLPYLLTAFGTTVYFGLLQYSLGPFLQQLIAVDANQASGMMGKLMMGAGIALLASQRLVKRFRWVGQKSTMIVAALFFLLAAVNLLVARDIWLPVVAVLLAAFAVGMLSPSYTTAVSLKTKGGQGAAAAWLVVAHTLGYGSGALIGGYSFEQWERGPFLAALVTSLLLIANLLNQPNGNLPIKLDTKRPKQFLGVSNGK